MKKCPYCAEEIQDAAIVCRYCGSDLHRGEDDSIIKKKSMTGNLGPILLTIGNILGELFAIYIVSLEFGLLGAAAAVIFFPVAIIVAPIYALIVYGEWLPLAVVYGSIGIGMLIMYRTEK